MSAQSIGSPYDVRRPVFELIEGNGVEEVSFETRDLLKRIRAIELHVIEIREILQLSTVGTQTEIRASAIKSLWKVFWISQTIGLASLVTAELTKTFGRITADLKFLGLGLTFIALESVFLAKLRVGRKIGNGEEEDGANS